MELFTIHCTTCKARLVVRDESLIGEILSCPKCQSMVQVVPPVEWKRPGSGDSLPGDLSVSAPVSSAPAVAEPDHQQPAPEPTADATQRKSVAAAAAIPPALPPRPQTASGADLPQPAAASTTAALPESSPAPATAFAGLAARAKQDWMLLAGGVLGGILLGAGIWFVVVTQSPAGIVAEAPEAEPASTDPPPLPDAPREQPPVPTAESPHSEAPADAPVDEPPVEPSSAAAPPGDAPQPSAPPAVEPAAVGKAPQASTPKLIPSLKLEPIRSGANLASEIATVPDAGSVLPSVGQATPSEPVVDDDQGIGTPEAGTPNLLSRDQINSRLALRLRQVDFAGVTLAEFAVFIADVAGVPVTFDEAALALTKKGRQTPITVKLPKTTTGEALRAAVEQAGLAVKLDDGRIVVTAPQ